MSRQPAWFPFYVRDYLCDTQRLTTAQHGAYMLLLFENWLAGSVPNNDEQLAAIVRTDVSTWRKAIAPAIMPFFDVGPTGLTQKRLMIERERASSLIDKRAESGKAGATKRWGKDAAPNGERNGEANGKPIAEPIANASPCHEKTGEIGWQTDAQYTIHKKEDKKEEDCELRSLPHRQADDGDFAAFWAAYPRKLDKGKALRAWKAARKLADTASIMAGLAKQVWPADLQFVPYPASWLNGRRWEDEPEAQSQPPQGKPRMPIVGDPCEAWMHLADEREIDENGVARPILAGWRLDACAEAVMIAAVIPWDTPMDWTPLMAWLRDGIEFANIEAAIKLRASRHGYQPPQSLKFFDAVVRSYRKPAEW